MLSLQVAFLSWFFQFCFCATKDMCVSWIFEFFMAVLPTHVNVKENGEEISPNYMVRTWGLVDAGSKYFLNKNKNKLECPWRFTPGRGFRGSRTIVPFEQEHEQMPNAQCQMPEESDAWNVACLVDWVKSAQGALFFDKPLIEIMIVFLTSRANTI